MAPDTQDDVRVQEFVRLLTAHQSQIYTFILGLVANHGDADDLMQETSAWMWKHFDEFRPGTSFLKWGMVIAHYRTLEHRRLKQRNSRPVFSERLIAQLQTRGAEEAVSANEYMDKLQNCISKLKTRDQQVVKLRYWDDLSVADISGRIQKTPRAIFYALSRIHDQLVKCVQQAWSMGGNPS